MISIPLRKWQTTRYIRLCRRTAFSLLPVKCLQTGTKQPTYQILRTPYSTLLYIYK